MTDDSKSQKSYSDTYHRVDVIETPIFMNKRLSPFDPFRGFGKIEKMEVLKKKNYTEIVMIKYQMDYFLIYCKVDQKSLQILNPGLLFVSFFLLTFK